MKWHRFGGGFHWSPGMDREHTVGVKKWEYKALYEGTARNIIRRYSFGNNRERGDDQETIEKTDINSGERKVEKEPVDFEDFYPFTSGGN